MTGLFTRSQLELGAGNAEGELARARALYAEMYDGFTVKHFHEKLVERHGYRLGYTVTRLALQASGAGAEGAAARGAPAQAAAAAVAGDDVHRTRRARVAGGQAAARPGGDAGRRDERDYSAMLVEEEGTASRFRALAEVLAEHGLL